MAPLNIETRTKYDVASIYILKLLSSFHRIRDNYRVSLECEWNFKMFLITHVIVQL